jgi:5-methylcytosine-specific restriction endonuclease McrA
MKNVKTECSGQWTVARKRSFIVSALRRASRRWKPIYDTKKNARIARNKYKCAMCNDIIGNKDAKIDHITPCVPISGWDDYDGFIKRLFVECDQLHCICKKCHDAKTGIENKERKANKYKVDDSYEKATLTIEHKR